MKVQIHGAQSRLVQHSRIYAPRVRVYNQNQWTTGQCCQIMILTSMLSLNLKAYQNCRYRTKTNCRWWPHSCWFIHSNASVVHFMGIARLDSYPPGSENIYLSGWNIEERAQVAVPFWHTLLIPISNLIRKSCSEFYSGCISAIESVRLCMLAKPKWSALGELP